VTARKRVLALRRATIRLHIFRTFSVRSFPWPETSAIPQVYRYVEDYVTRRVDFRDENPCELGLEKYVKRIEGLFLAAITPDESQGETPLLPLLNRTKPIGLTADVALNTTRACYVLTLVTW
jgi:hypothetical protein